MRVSDWQRNGFKCGVARKMITKTNLDEAAAKDRKSMQLINSIMRRFTMEKENIFDS